MPAISTKDPNINTLGTISQDVYLPASIVTSSLITIGVASFVAKWMFAELTQYWKKEFAELKQEVKNLADRDEALKAQMLLLERKLTSEYVSREDWIRATVALETKFDRLDGRVTQQLDRLLDKIEQNHQLIVTRNCEGK